MEKLTTKLPDVRVSEALLTEIRLAGAAEGRTISDVVRRVLVQEFTGRVVARAAQEQARAA